MIHSEKMSSNLKVSVVIATLNRPDSLADCLKSLEEQIVVPDEVIIVVDGKLTNEVRRVIDTHKGNKKLNIIQINNGERKGGAFSKNKGADAASGEIVAFVDDDVTLVPDWTIQIQKGYEEYKDAVGVGGRVVMSQPLFNNIFYRFFTKARWYLLRGKIGKLSFIGMPYFSLTLADNNNKCLVVDFLHGGNVTYRRKTFCSYRFDGLLFPHCEVDICVRLKKDKRGKLIYNPQAVAYHSHTTVGGVGLQGHQRLYLDFQKHTTYLMKDFTFKYLRFAVFAILVLIFSIITLKPRYIKAVVDGFKLYWNQESGREPATTERLKE